MGEDTKGTGKIWVMVFILVSIIIAVLAYAFIRFREQGVAIVINNVVRILFWIIITGMIVLFVYFILFFQQQRNTNEEVRRELKKECKFNNMNNLGVLFSTGDQDHRPMKLGKIVGYSSRTNATKGENFEEDVYLVRRGFKDFIVRCPSHLRRGKLSGDIYITCSALNRLSGYFYPNTIYRDMDSIDKTIYFEGMRYTDLDLIGKTLPILYKALGISRADIKELEGKKGGEMIGEAVGNIKPGGSK